MCTSVSENDEKEGLCNKVVVNNAHEHFAFTTKVEEVINPQKIMKILQSDFIESSLRVKPYSEDDKKYTLERGIPKRRDSHYELPLPLKSE